MKRALSYLTTIVCITLVGCIDRIDLSLDGDNNRLVVEGLITDEEGPYTVKVSRSLAFDNSGLATSYFKPERNAAVYILSDAGEEVQLQEISPGVYNTDTLAIRGQVGRSYWVHVSTTDGNTYTSIPEVLLATPVIDELIPTFVAIPRKSTTGNDVLIYRFNISIVSKDPPGVDNYYRWKSTGIIEYESTTENPLIHTCWVGYAPLEGKVTVADDRLIDGNTFVQEVGIAPYERPTRFQAKVSQFSLTPRAFEFWKIIAQQQESVGSIFDPPPAQIVGNIINESDANDIPLGYFGASAVSEIALVFDRFRASNFFFPPENIPPQGGDCRLHEFNATNVRPEGF